jgi:hypothetical protein
MRCPKGYRIPVWVFITIVVTPICAHAQSLAAAAIKSCINYSIRHNQLFADVPIYDQNKRVIRTDHAIACTGQVAENMWNQMYPHRVGDLSRFKTADNETHGQFYFGKHSVCVRRIFNSARQPTTGFDCYIYLDLTRSLKAALQ